MENGIKNLKESCLKLAWKVKAIKRRCEMKALGKRFKEMEESRDKWKQKASERQAEIEKLVSEMKALRKDFEDQSKKKV